MANAAPRIDESGEMMGANTCAGCGQYFPSSDDIAATVIFSYAKFQVSDDYCFECRYEIIKAVKRLHKKEAKANHG